MQTRRAFTLRELFVVIFVIAVFLALLLPALQHSYTPRRRSNCVSNLKQFGIALANYHDNLKRFPPGGIRRGDDPAQTYASAHAILMPYFEEVGLHTLYDPTKDWLYQRSEVAPTVIPVFVCPSSLLNNPFEDELLNRLVLSAGGPTTSGKRQYLGKTNYVFCKGVTDSWCHGPNFGPPGPPAVPPSERGMIDMNWSMSIRQITDGTSKTIAMGEAADGQWPLTATTKSHPNRWRSAPVDGFGRHRWASQAWIAMQPSTQALSAQGLYVSSVMACTLEWMNKNPVTDSWADTTALDDCRKSLPSAPGTTGPTTRDGPHVTPNFRSDHPGGANFLFADGSVHFLTEDIDMLLYQRLSTAMEGEAAEVPD